MHPHVKKVAMMSAISVGLIIFAYIIPIFVVPVAIAASGRAGCTDYDCAGATFAKCGGYSNKESSDLVDSWTSGMEGMMCLMGIEKGTSVNAFTGQITLNKV
jgi:hypothetical protein